ncbi:hypothetical protein RZS08_01035, partial [Arthrospira platensis SPKY1]|nr:hypothetical protein [Arthrospira platensis SPKY1]
ADSRGLTLMPVRESRAGGRELEPAAADQHPHGRAGGEELWRPDHALSKDLTRDQVPGGFQALPVGGTEEDGRHALGPVDFGEFQVVFGEHGPGADRVSHRPGGPPCPHGDGQKN